MKMRFNLRRGLVIELSLCLGIVLLLAFVASIAPAAAQTQTPCVDQCGPCQVDPTQQPVVTTTVRCSPICRILYNGQMTTVYLWYYMTCTTKKMAQPCTDPCINNGCGIIWDPTFCKGTVSTCTPWTQFGGVRYGSCGQQPPLPP
jgi:hypothetical protein